MASLAVWKFDTSSGANMALQKFQELAKQQLIQIQDAEVVSWLPGKSRPKTQETSTAGAGALTGDFTRVGISDDFIKQMCGKITAGTSVLVLLMDQATIDRLSDAFKGTKMEPIKFKLTEEQESKPKEAYGEKQR